MLVKITLKCNSIKMSYNCNTKIIFSTRVIHLKHDIFKMIFSKNWNSLSLILNVWFNLFLTVQCMSTIKIKIIMAKKHFPALEQFSWYTQDNGCKAFLKKNRKVFFFGVGGGWGVSILDKGTLSLYVTIYYWIKFYINNNTIK